MHARASWKQELAEAHLAGAEVAIHVGKGHSPPGQIAIAKNKLFTSYLASNAGLVASYS